MLFYIWVGKEREVSVMKNKKEKFVDVLVVIFAIAATIAIFTFFAIVGLDLKKRDFDYSAKGVMKDSATVITEDGNIWKYDTNYKKDTKVVVKFHTNGTSSIKDDIITEVKKMTS